MSKTAKSLTIGALVLLAAGVLLYSRRNGRPNPAQRKSQPYWQRTGFLSKFLQDLDPGARGIQSIQVPEGFEVTLAAGPDLVNYPMFIAYDDRGRLFVCESAGKNMADDEMQAKPEMRIRLLEDTDGDGVFDRSKIFADKITMTMGAQWYRGSLYVAAPPDFLRFDDTNGDGVADRREVILTGWPLHSNGTTMHGPYFGPDGLMYLTYNLGHYRIDTREGKRLEGPGGRVWRMRPDGTGLEWIVGGGYDNGIEMVFNGAGEMFGTMTYYRNPKFGERDALLHYVEGGVYPKVSPVVNKYKRTGDLMPAMTKFARIAPAGLLLYRGAAFGPAYQENLFSAQFNPHRIQRHIMERDGATFRTKDEDFLTSTDPDFHPTDVTEDADGSLLVVETGAWYLHSCPVSRIAKPEFKGAIYRVRRKGAPRAEDPWGLNLKLETRPPAELVRSLDEPRPAVRDKVVELLVQASEPAVEPLIQVRQTHAAPEVRASAVFALGRIGKTAAVREALSDAHFLVRIAAARMAGLAKDKDAVPKLLQIVKKDEPPARRQAATALGQIGDPQAVKDLLAAAANPEDRFVEHAIIYSLITLQTPGPVQEALKNPSPKVRKAALIALDQMDGSPLQRDHLRASLNDADPELRRASLWVVSRHPDWSGELIKLLSPRSPDEAQAVHEALLSVCENPEAQKAIGELLLLDTMEQCAVKEFPALWTERLRQQLRGKDVAVRARVVALVRARQIAALDDELQRMAASSEESNDLRTAALGVLVTRRPALTEPDFRFLLTSLRPETDADLRQSAAQILGRAKLSEAQMLVLAREHLSGADPLILPNLLDAFRGASQEEVGKALVSGLLNSPHPADGIAAERIPAMLKSFPTTVQSAALPLLTRIAKEKESRDQRLHSLEPLLDGGDQDRGREVFFGKKAGCASCHTIMSDGGDVGPDLTGVGAIRSGLDLLEAVVYPSASFVPGHEVYRVETAREVHTGVQGDSSPDAVMIISGPRDRVRIPRKEIVSMRPSTVSLMPDGFAENLSHRELSDLLAFLQSQKSRTVAAAR